MCSSSRGTRSGARRHLSAIAAYLRSTSAPVEGPADVQAMARAAVEGLGPLLDVSRCILVLANHPGEAPVQAQWTAGSVPFPDPLSYLDAAAYRALVPGRALVYDAAEADPAGAAFVEAHTPPGQEPPAAAAFVPVRKDRSPVGCLAVHETRRARVWTEEERDLLAAAADQIGAALAQADARRALEEGRSWLELVIDTMTEGIAVIDEQGRFLRLNPAGRSILGLTEPPAGDLRLQDTARMDIEVRYPAGGPIPPDQMVTRRALRGEVVRDVEEVIRHRKTGREIHVRLSAAPIRGPAGGIRGAVIVAVDMTRMKELARLKDDFFSMVSHELRTPLTTMRGAALALQRYGDTLDPEDRRQLLSDLVDEGERLHLMVEDLLGLAKSHVGLILQLEPVSLRAFLDRVLPSMRERFGCAALAWHVLPDVPALEADVTYLEQIVRNLVSNACRHAGTSTEILVTARREGRMVRLSVLDRGPGIAPDDRERVFEPFFHARASAARERGAGLGLSVVRRLTEVMGGQVWVEARDGGGAAFHVLLPAALPEG